MTKMKSLADLSTLNPNLDAGAKGKVEETTETRKPKKNTGKVDLSVERKTVPAPAKPAEKATTEVEEPTDAEVAAVAQKLQSMQGEEEGSDEVLEEAGLEDEEFVTEKSMIQETVIALPYRKCHVCRHLLPTLPNKLPKEMGGGKGKYGAEYKCYTEEGCPAQFLRLEFSPFTDDVLSEAVEAFKTGADLASLSKLYASAHEASESIYSDVHQRVVNLLRG